MLAKLLTFWMSILLLLPQGVCACQWSTASPAPAEGSPVVCTAEPEAGCACCRRRNQAAAPAKVQPTSPRNEAEHSHPPGCPASEARVLASGPAPVEFAPLPTLAVLLDFTACGNSVAVSTLPGHLLFTAGTHAPPVPHPILRC